MDGCTTFAGYCRVTVADVVGTPGTALAMIVARPVPEPVTGTIALVVPCAMVTELGTVATPGLLEPREIVRPPGGAAPDRFSVRFAVAAPAIVKVPGEKLSVATTWIVWTPVV